MSGALLKLPKEQRARLARELGRGEIVLWAAVPDWRSAIPAVLLKLVFALVVMGFVLTWEGLAFGFFWDAWFGANRSRTPPVFAAIFALFGLPFLLIGLAGLGAPVRTLREARSTLYAVTTKRVLVLVGQPGGRTQSILPSGIRRIERRSAPVVGNLITLVHGVETDPEGDKVESTWLYGVADAAGAEAALRMLAASEPATASPDASGAPRPA